MTKPTDTPETDNHEIYADIGDDSEQGDWAYVVPSDFARSLERRNAELVSRVAELEASLTEATKKQPINTHLRLFDLVRYMRAELHQEELITDEEYGQLCAGPMAMSPKGGSPSRQRLEDYDELRSQLTEARKDGQRLDWLLEYITQHGTDGIGDLEWTIIEEEEGDAIMERASIAFDRPTIDRAMHPEPKEGK